MEDCSKEIHGERLLMVRNEEEGANRNTAKERKREKSLVGGLLQGRNEERLLIGQK